MCMGPVKLLVLALSTARGAFLRTSCISVHDARTSACYTMPAPRRGGTAVAIFWSPFCYLPEYLPPHVMTIHECYEIESYYRGLLMPFVMGVNGALLSLVGCQMVARWMQGNVDPIETQEPKAEAHARALRHAAFIIQLHCSGDPNQLASAYEFVFKDLSAEQVGAIADQIQMKPGDKKRFVDGFASESYYDVLRALDASGQELQLRTQPIAQRDAKWRRWWTKKASDTSI